MRMFMGVVFAAVVWFTPMFGSDGNFPLMYYVIIIAIFMLHQVCVAVLMCVLVNLIVSTFLIYSMHCCVFVCANAVLLSINT